MSSADTHTQNGGHAHTPKGDYGEKRKLIFYKEGGKKTKVGSVTGTWYASWEPYTITRSGDRVPDRQMRAPGNEMRKEAKSSQKVLTVGPKRVLGSLLFAQICKK